MWAWRSFLEGRRSLDIIGQPGQALRQTLTGGGTAWYHKPDLVFQLGELEGLGDFLRFHSWGEGSHSQYVDESATSGEAESNLPSWRSCLLAKTSSRLSFISRSLMMRWSSCRASSMRARSEESMTKMRPWVPASQKKVSLVSHASAEDGRRRNGHKPGNHSSPCEMDAMDAPLK